MPRNVRRRACGLVMVAIAIGACGSPGGTFRATDPPPSPSSASPGSAAPPSDAGPSAGAPTAGSGESPPAPPPGFPAWAKLEVGGTLPRPREDHTWTVDPEAGVAYLFGGRSGGTPFDDLWAFDLATNAWSQLEVAGPVPA